MIMSLLIILSAGTIVQAEEGEDSKHSEEYGLNAGSTYKVGDIVNFGHYEQDGNTANGKEEIEWEVLKVESDRMLVISKYALDCKKYNETLSILTDEIILMMFIKNIQTK